MPPDSFDSSITVQDRDQISSGGDLGLNASKHRVLGKDGERSSCPGAGNLVDFARRWWFSATARRDSAGHAGDCERESPKNGLICAANSYYLACGDHTSIRKKIHIPAAPQCGDLCAKTEGNK